VSQPQGAMLSSAAVAHGCHTLARMATDRKWESAAVELKHWTPVRAPFHVCVGTVT
jgi:hypothetical protein